MEGHETTIASLAMKCREGLESLPLSEQNPWVKDQSAQFNSECCPGPFSLPRLSKLVLRRKLEYSSDIS